MSKYRIYPSLLDAYTQYVRSDDIWDKYWGFSENPPHTPEEFREKQLRSCIDRINRVPMAWEDSEAADRGTALNEVVDCLVEHRPSKRCVVARVYGRNVTGNAGSAFDAPEMSGDVEESPEVEALDVAYNKRVFRFDIMLVRSLAAYLSGSLTQQRVEAVLPTAFGDVTLYGLPDYIRPFSVVDLKTTGSYSFGKYRHNAQHLVYPYIIEQTGGSARLFEYRVVELNKWGKWEQFSETYTYDPERDIPTLTRMVEDFIRFVEENRNNITDKKIFNG